MHAYLLDLLKYIKNTEKMSATSASNNNDAFRGPSYRTQMATVCSGVGISSIVLLNSLRHRPLMFRK